MVRPSGEVRAGVTNTLRIFICHFPADRQLLKWTLAVFLLLATLRGAESVAQTVAGGTTSDLVGGFADPPRSARPRVWWHWMDGNVSEAGIVKDLEWMDRAGIGGVQYFDGSLHTPQVVPIRVPFGGDPWRASFARAVSVSEAKDLEFTIASSPGWSETGGPWVRPEQAMKKLVWSELEVDGGKLVELRLPSPPNISGPFQEVPGGGAEPSAPQVSGLPSLYRDSVVIAHRIPLAGSTPAASVTASAPIDVNRLLQGDRTDFQRLAMGPDQQGWVNFSYPAPTTHRAVELVLDPGPRIGPIYPSWPAGQIEASDDGLIYRKIADLPIRGAPQQTVAFPATTARHFRILLRDRFSPFAVKAFSPPETTVADHGVARVRFISEARVTRFEDKAGWSTIPGLGAMATPDADAEAVVSRHDVVDLTDRLEVDGSLHWIPPPGRWRILRLGWSLTGKLNNPASKEGTGLEVDKLNSDHVKAYADAYLRIFEEAVGSSRLGERGIGYMLNDSYEAMAANWTDDILDEFAKRRGYDPLPWLPVLTGRVVDAAEDSDRFLWDFRRTLADLIAEEHYGVLSAELIARGMGRYGEAHEALRAFIGDGIEVKKSADVPMGATWAMPNPSMLLPDILESASVSHLYGQNIVAAESFTTLFPAYGFDPARLKPFADKMMANGVNRFVIHTSVHQPNDTAGPGIGLGSVGQWFTRKETWAEMASAWTSYLSRSSHLLQQGRFVADIAWFYGEDDNITALYDERPPAVPSGFAFDFINADAIRNIVHGKDGWLVSKGGGRYQVLAIDPAARLTLPTLRRLDALSRNGVIIAGKKPIRSPSLADDDDQYAELAESIWGRRDRTYATLEMAISKRRIPPDVDLGSSKLAFVHRELQDADVYFISNLSESPVTTDASFRIVGRAPEIWRADDGSIRPASFNIVDGRTEIPLSVDSQDAFFIVFRSHTERSSFRATEFDTESLQTLTGEWNFSFFPEPSAPTSMKVESLTSWTESDDPRVRYYSGVGRYSKSFNLPRLPSHARLLVDLGDVANVARVLVNNTSVGYAWKKPYRLDITESALTGSNEIVIEVANLWPNRLIGDMQPGAQASKIQASFNPFSVDSPLLPSGLLGPVQLMISEQKPSAGDAPN